MMNGLPEYYTPDEIAKILKIHRWTVIRRFANVPGVIDLAGPRKISKRRYRVLRIPPEALARFLSEKRVDAKGGSR